MHELSRRVLSREVNTKIREIHDGFAENDEHYELLCECGREGCEERVAVPVSLNGELGGGERYIVARGHEERERERVVAERPTFSVVAPSAPAAGPA